MNANTDSRNERPTPWYRVGEVWLMLALLAGAVFGSLGLVATALHNPDRHLTAPGDTPHPSHQPPSPKVVAHHPAHEAPPVD